MTLDDNAVIEDGVERVTAAAVVGMAHGAIDLLELLQWCAEHVIPAPGAAIYGLDVNALEAWVDERRAGATCATSAHADTIPSPMSETNRYGASTISRPSSPLRQTRVS